MRSRSVCEFFTNVKMHSSPFLGQRFANVCSMTHLIQAYKHVTGRAGIRKPPLQASDRDNILVRDAMKHMSLAFASILCCHVLRM